MKKIFLIILFIVTGLTLSAQEKNGRIKIQLGPEFTVGLFADGYSTGLGFHITYYHEVAKGGSIAGSTGYASWNIKEGVGTGSAGMVLGRFGYRQFVTEGLYVQADAGIGLGEKNFTGRTRFVMDGGLGYLFATKKKARLDISGRVNRGFNRTWIGLGLGVQF